jgi:2-polyprenyl-3-methyl-5-hydroxy-6-metoxy-1,4-benzoquinol methylase
MRADGIELENIPCPLCGDRRCDPKLQAPDRFDTKGATVYQIVACANCHFIFVNPRPGKNWIGAAYQNANYQPFMSAQSQRSLWDRLYDFARSLNVRSKRRKIELLKPKGSILDVGCGTGEFLNQMQVKGWQASGIETDAPAAAFAKSEYGLAISNSDLASVGFDEKSFDVITFWHVLEHVFDPIPTLKMAARILKDDGIMLVACPNIESADAKFYGRDWVPLDAPRHLSHFVPASAARAAEESGLTVFKLQPMFLDAIYNCLMSEQLVAAGKHPIARLLLLRALPIAGFSLAASIFDNGRGSAIIYYLRKRGS